MQGPGDVSCCRAAPSPELLLFDDLQTWQSVTPFVVASSNLQFPARLGRAASSD